jgi:hypothetical protein
VRRRHTGHFTARDLQEHLARDRDRFEGKETNAGSGQIS